MKKLKRILQLRKAKYKRRWRGKGGEWKYEYDKLRPPGRDRSKPAVERHIYEHTLKEKAKGVAAKEAADMVKDIDIVSGVSYYQDTNEIYVLYDTPREVRHPDEYYGPEEDVYSDPQFEKFFESEAKVEQAIEKLGKKYPKLEFSTAADVSGATRVFRKRGKSY